jgi:WD40 repeat protein
MGRPERPVDPDAGPVQALAWQLRQVRAAGGQPSYRSMARRANYSPSTLAEAASGERLPTLDVTLAYVRACEGDEDRWRALWHETARIVADRSDEGRAQDSGECPYRGLLTFQTADAKWFFGRSRLVARLLDRIDRLPVVGVFGPSGVGKSSLLRAGLLGAVQADAATADRWRTALMTPTEHPLDALVAQIARIAVVEPTRLGEQLQEDPAALEIAVRGALVTGPDQTRLLLVVDQFDEVFTLCPDPAERVRFLDALLDLAVGHQRRTTVVLGVRADFLPHVARYAGLVDALSGDAQVLVGPATPDELREMIVEPAEGAGCTVHADLLTTVLADAAREPGALAFLSHALRETWQARDGARLTLAGYRATGGVRGAIAQTAERIYESLAPEQRAVARQVFLRLCTLGDGTDDTRRPINRAELDGIADPGTLAEVLAHLAAGRLVVLDAGTVDMAHEILIRGWPRLHRWLTDDRAGLAEHRRLTAAALAWEALGRDNGALLRGASLESARTWSDAHPGELNRLEAEFLDASGALAADARRAAARRIRMRRALVAVTAVLSLLAVGGGAAAVYGQRAADDQRTLAISHELSLKARSLLATDPDLAGLLAVEAHRLHPDADTRGAVLAAAAAARRRIELNTGGPVIWKVAISPDARQVAAAGADGVVTLWDVRGRRAAATYTEHRDGVPPGESRYARAVAFSRDGRLLASVARAPGLAPGAGSVVVRDVTTGRRVLDQRRPALTGAMAFSADGSHVAIGLGDGGVELFEVANGTSRILPLGGLRVRSLAFDAARRLLVASAGGATQPSVWDVATGAPVAAIPVEDVHTVTFVADTATVVTGSARTGVRLWDVVPGTAVLRSELPQPLFARDVSEPSGDRIAVVDHDGVVTVWDLRVRQPVARYRDRHRAEALALALGGDGELLVSAGLGGTIVVRESAVPPFGGHTAAVTDIEVEPAGTRAASGGADRTVRLWDQAGHLLATLADHPDEVQSIAFDPRGRRLAVVSRDNTLTVWDIERSHRLAVLPFAGTAAATAVAVDPEGRDVTVAAFGRFRWSLDAAGRLTARPISNPAIVATALVYTPDGRSLVSTSPTSGLLIWDVETDRQQVSVRTGQGAVLDVAVSPDSTLIATAGADRTVRLFDRNGAAVAVLTGHSAPVQAVAFSRDGRTIAAAGADGSIVVWDVASRRTVANLTGHGERVQGLAFTAAGDVLSGADDGRIIRWSLDVPAAVARICREVGRDLTRAEWRTYVGAAPYRRACPGDAG